MDIVEKLLDSGFSNGWTRAPWVIVIHYTAGFTAEQTYKALIKRNLSVHFTIERDGTLYKNLEDKHRAWHAGRGQWGGYSNMNNHSLGIEAVNFGWANGEFTGSSRYKVYRYKDKSDPEVFQGESEFYRDERYKKTKVRVITKQECSQALDHRNSWAGKYWANYPDEQINSIAWQAFQWMKRYKILPENVIGHEHASPDRKYDPGPAFPWKKLNDIIVEMAASEAPELIDIDFNRKLRVKAVQSHCSRMGLPVGDIDGWWGANTAAAVELARIKYGEYYGFGNLKIDQDNLIEIASSLRLVPGFDPGRR